MNAHARSCMCTRHTPTDLSICLSACICGFSYMFLLVSLSTCQPFAPYLSIKSACLHAHLPFAGLLSRHMHIRERERETERERESERERERERERESEREREREEITRNRDSRCVCARAWVHLLCACPQAGRNVGMRVDVKC